MRTLESLKEIDGVIDVTVVSEHQRIHRERDSYGLTAELTIACDDSRRLDGIGLQMGDLIVCFGARYIVALDEPDVRSRHGWVELVYTLQSGW